MILCDFALMSRYHSWCDEALSSIYVLISKRPNNNMLVTGLHYSVHMLHSNNRINNAILVDNNREITYLGNIASIDSGLFGEIIQNNNGEWYIRCFLIHHKTTLAVTFFFECR